MDVKHEISAVARKVGARTIDAGQANTVIVSRVYDTTLDDLWDACTNAERIPRWFTPVTGDLRLGGRYQLEGNAGGTIERCDPPHGFDATWEFGDNVSSIELRLSEVDGGARFELTHITGVEDDHWREFGPGAVGIGWEMGLLGLEAYLGGGERPSMAEAMAWMASDEGKEFIALSGGHWADAHLAAGADPDAARASAQRNEAFYTGAGA